MQEVPIKLSEKIAENHIQKLPKNRIKKMIAVVSGKGGVGKSTITALIANELAGRGHSVGILDADVGGASISHLYGLEKSDMDGWFATTKNGIKVLSFYLLAKDKERASIWRGALVTNAIKQIYTQLDFGELDYLIIDSPPGTSDMPLTLYQFFPLDGIIIVTSPHSLVQEIVKRSLSMAQKLNVPIIGIVENKSYFICDKCNEKHFLFGQSKTESIAKNHGIRLLAEIPMDKELSELEEKGKIYEFKSSEIGSLIQAL